MNDAINLVDLIKEFGDDDNCRRYIEVLRWRNGVTCPRCEKPATAISNRTQYDCDACHYQFSATSGTIFHDTHLPLTKWFLATYLLCESKKGMSACQIQRTLGISPTRPRGTSAIASVRPCWK